MRVVVALLDGKPAGLVGVTSGIQGCRFFSEHKPELEPYLSSVAVWRGIKMAMEIAKRQRGVLYAVASGAEGARILRRLGFIGEGDVFWLRPQQ